MKGLTLKLIFLPFLFLKILPAAITTKEWPGRFGDQLILYIKAKWLAYKYNMTFFYRPFKYSNRLSLSLNERLFTRSLEKEYKTNIELKSEVDILSSNNQSALYFCNYFLKLSDYTVMNRNLYEIMVQNPEFKEHLTKMLCPLQAQNLSLPKDRFTIAVHVRKGGGIDGPLLSLQLYNAFKSYKLYNHINYSSKAYADVQYPLKFVPEQFYIDQINFLSSIIMKPLYVHIFTDDPDPKSIADTFEKKCHMKNIIFSYRNKNNRHNKNVVEDFWKMSKFDCLIRPYSYLSLAAQLIGNHSIVIHPFKYMWKDRKLIITDVEIIRPDKGKKEVSYELIQRR